MSKRKGIDARVGVVGNKGASTRPKAGPTANREDRRNRSSTTTFGDVLSSTDAQWLLEELVRGNLPEPRVAPSTTGKSWIIWSRGKMVGRLTTDQVVKRRTDLVEGICEQKTVVRADVGRAIDAEWPEVSRNLHAARSRIDEIVNACTRALVVHSMSGGAAPNLYATAQAEDAASAGRALATLLKLEGKKPFDAPEAEAQRLREIERRRVESVLKLSSTILSSVTQRAQSSYLAWEKDRRNRHFPHAKQGQPIPFRASDGWRLTREKGSFVAEVKLVSGGDTGRYRFKVHPSGGSALASARDLADGVATGCDAKLLWDEDRKRWILAMTIGRKRRQPPSLSGNPLTMVIRLGMRNLLTAWFSDGTSVDVWVGQRVGATFVSLLKRKQELLREKCDRQRGMAEMTRGPSAVRRLDRGKLGALGKKESRFVDTNCKQVAAFVANLAADRGPTRIVVQVPAKPFSDEDAKRLDRWLTSALRRFPFKKLSNAMVWALEKRGFSAEVVDVGYDACTCPACGTVDGRNNDPATQKFRCVNEKCGLGGNSDRMAAVNAMGRSGVSDGEMKQLLTKAWISWKALLELNNKKDSAA